MLKAGLNAALKVRTAGNLGKLEIRPIPAEARRHAAVALVILDQHEDAAFANIPFLPLHASQAAFILAIRSEGLKDHGGQRAFPGGRIDAGETPEEAALLGKATRVAQFDQPRFAWS